MPEEILNIEYHRKDLIIKALNRKRTHKEAATALGVSVRTLMRDKRTYNIQKLKGQYQIIEKTNNESQKLHLRSSCDHIHG
jgi:predicted DNA-binding transcriptional regulator YafY